MLFLDKITNFCSEVKYQFLARDGEEDDGLVTALNFLGVNFIPVAVVLSGDEKFCPLGEHAFGRLSSDCNF